MKHKVIDRRRYARINTALGTRFVINGSHETSSIIHKNSLRRVSIPSKRVDFLNLVLILL